MSENKDLLQQAEEAVKKVEDAGENVVEKVKEMDLVESAKGAADKAVTSLKSTFLGEDGKFDKEDVDRLAASAKETADKAVESVKNSSVGKAVLGEDGKFDKEDVDRLTASAKDAAENVVNTVKNFFNKE